MLAVKSEIWRAFKQKPQRKLKHNNDDRGMIHTR